MSGDVRAGDLRFAGDIEGERLPSGVHARLVLVVDVLGADVVLALLVTEEVHIAGAADLLLGPTETGLDLQLCVQTDLAVSLATAQLGPPVATIETSVLDVVRRAFADGAVPDGGMADQLPRGLPLGSPSDARWAMKLAELDDVQQLGRTVEDRAHGEGIAEPDMTDLDLVRSLWQIELGSGSRLAGALRGPDAGVDEVFTLDEQAFVELVGRPREEHEDRPHLRVRLTLDPACLRVRLTVPGGLADTVQQIVVVAGDTRVPLDVTDQDDVAFDGDVPYAIAAVPEAATLRLEVTRRD